MLMTSRLEIIGNCTIQYKNEQYKAEKYRLIEPPFSDRYFYKTENFWINPYEAEIYKLTEITTMNSLFKDIYFDKILQLYAQGSVVIVD